MFIFYCTVDSCLIIVKNTHLMVELMYDCMLINNFLIQAYI